MKGLLIYDKDGAKRNEWFINRLISCALKKGVTLSLTITENKRIEDTKNCDFAIVRTIAPQINKYLESKKIRVFNNYLTSLTANDKWRTHLLCAELDVPTMHTEKDRAGAPPFLPCVIKCVDGHGGDEVFLARAVEEYDNAVSKLRTLGKEFIVQQPCSELGKDMRAYVLGGKVIACALRQSDRDFRSNYSLGGSCSLARPTDGQLRDIAKIVNALGCDYVGVDFIRHDGKWVLNEIEDAVGARMLYELTDLDIAELYIDHILQSL